MTSALSAAAGASQVDDIRRIMEMLPHRYPFLLVDRVVAFESGVGLRAYKNVTINEGFFQGHFPGQPIMPGVLILEAMAQTGGIFVVKTLGIDTQDKLFLFTGIDGAKFRRPVLPGDRLDISAQLIRRKMNIWKMQGQATVDGELAAEGVFTAAIVDKGKL
jgi:3-hydroxyacyl-[acyl-carrier-protein] dehydratase